MTTKEERRLKIKAGVRGKISGTPERPRLTVFRSNKQIYAQVIDDTTGKTLAAASSLKMDVKAPKKEIAAKVGEQIAKVASISAADEEVGQLVADAMEKVSQDGVITIEESKTMKTELDFNEDGRS